MEEGGQQVLMHRFHVSLIVPSSSSFNIIRCDPLIKCPLYYRIFVFLSLTIMYGHKHYTPAYIFLPNYILCRFPKKTYKKSIDLLGREGEGG